MSSSSTSSLLSQTEFFLVLGLRPVNPNNRKLVVYRRALKERLRNRDSNTLNTDVHRSRSSKRSVETQTDASSFARAVVNASSLSSSEVVSRSAGSSSASRCPSSSLHLHPFLVSSHHHDRCRMPKSIVVRRDYGVKGVKTASKAKEYCALNRIQNCQPRMRPEVMPGLTKIHLEWLLKLQRLRIQSEVKHYNGSFKVPQQEAKRTEHEHKERT